MEESMENIEHLERTRDFFAGRSVFITGFTGYLGKILVEKLLWLSPDIKCIYILMRANKKKTIQERLTHIYDLFLFDRLRERDGNKWMDKLIAIEGDISKENLGLSESDLNSVINSVSVVFHSAAHILFNDPLTVPIRTNTGGTKNICDLALRMKNLESFLYISTAYSNCHHLTIEEKVYPPLADWRDVLKICDKIDPGTIAILTEKYIRPQPNTYVFSKQITESLVDSYKDVLPVSILRPSIIVPTWKKPMPGWSDSRFGPILPFIGGISRIMTSTLMNPDTLIDPVYVDWVVNGCVLVSMKRALLPKLSDKTPVYNSCLYHKSFTYRAFIDHTRQPKVLKDTTKHGFTTGCRIIMSKFWFIADFFPRAILSAFFIDFLLGLLGKPKIVTTIRLKIYEMIFVLHYFTSNSFQLKNHRLMAILKSTHPDEIDELGYSLSDDYDERTEQIRISFYQGYEMAIKKVVAKKLFEKADELRIYIKLLTISDRACFYLFYLLLFYIGSKLFTPLLAASAAALFAIGYYRNVDL